MKQNTTNFFNYIQPHIIKLTNDEELPEHLRNHYMLNFNAIGIQYFIDNCMLVEDPENYGKFLYMLTNEAEKIRLANIDESDVLDIPRAYIVLTPELLADQTTFRDWLLSVIADCSRFLMGNANFIPGKDYYINTTLWNYLSEYESQFVNDDMKKFVLPNYLDQSFALTKYYEELPEDLITFNNIQYFYYKNDLLNLEYTEDELKSLYNTFYNIIKDETLIDADKLITTNNQIYEKVVNYFANWMSDDALVSINLLLNTQTTQKVEGVSSCGCNFGSNQMSLSEKSCYSLYETAMTEYNTQMFADPEFYKDWMWMILPDGTQLPNTPMIEHLIVLLQEFESLNFDLSFNKSYSVHQYCGCDNSNTAKSEENHKTIQNFIKVLSWIADGCIDENINKIKVYGKKFSELLPLLSF